VFKESFWRARNELEKTNARFNPQQLDATDVRLDHAYLADADLAQALLVPASLREADLGKAQLQGANLFGAQLKGVNLTKANPEDATSLEDTKMNEIIGLTQEQREQCIKKGAIFDDIQQAPASDANSSSSLPPSPSNDTPPSAPSAQVNTPPADADGSSPTPSKPGPTS
jgi:uncharacterized protein YjbI with pentapeptide repeats